MSRTTLSIVISEAEREVLNAWSRSRKLPWRQVQRAKIVLLAVSGLPNKDIALQLKISRPTVQLWRGRFLDLRLKGLEKDAPRPGRKPRLALAKINAVVAATLNSTPIDATHWSVRSMARAQQLSPATIHRIWRRYDLKPHLVHTFKVSRDKALRQKLEDVVGLYLNPPDKALVLCIDEKTQIQALDRTQPGLPLKRGRCGTMTHDYKRNGTINLFAALNLLDGKVIGSCTPRHRHQELIRFLAQIDRETPAGLDLHLITDNYGTRNHPRTKAWLKRHPRFHLHFTPTSCSWLNLVERWLLELTRKRIRRGSYANVPALVASILGYIGNYNQNPHIFTWTASADQILRKIAKSKEALETVH
jgi:transposase